MISDNYMPETAKMLHEAGYVAAFMEDVQEGDSIAIMQKNFHDGEHDEITFLTAVSVKRDPQVDRDESSGRLVQVGSLVRFIGKFDNGATIPCSYGGSWGIYIRRNHG